MVNRKSITYVFVSFTPRSGIFFQTLQYLLNQSSITDGCLSVMNFRTFHLISTFNSIKFRVISHLCHIWQPRLSAVTVSQK